MTVVQQLDEAAADDRLDYLSHMLSSRVVPIEFQPADGVDLTARFVTGHLGALRVSEVTGSAGVCQRTLQLVRRSDPDQYEVTVVTQGQAMHEQAGQQTRLAPGDFTIVHSSHSFRTAHSPVGLVAISFPSAMMPLHPHRLARLTGIHLDGGQGVGALVSTLIQRLPRHLDDPSAANGARLGATVVDLLTVALADRLEDGDGAAADARQRALLPRIFAFIQERLADPDLSPAMIAAAHHISLRYLHKLFEGEGTTVARWIRESRLERCRRDLLDPALASRSLSATAIRWGFANGAHFNRVFRAAYGASPGAYRDRHTS
jgi:AraC-like DNA-binding protein